MKELFNFCWMMLGWFVAGLIFVFCVCLLLTAIYLSIAIGRELYDEYIKGMFKRRRNEDI